ncbi:MAG: hypothetical protein AB7G87_05740 [Clostridia bacterium]
MKRIVNVVLVLSLMFTMFVGCGTKQVPASQKSEEQIKAELRAEMEAEEKKKEALKAELKAEMEAEQKKQEGATVKQESQGQEKQQVPAKQNQEVKKEVEAPKAAEAPKTQEVNQEAKKPETPTNALIESVSGYFKFRANATAYFDVDEDGKDEEIKYDTANGKLTINGYKAIDIDTMFAEKEYFVIVSFSDKFDNKMNMIGIIDYGPSNDYSTGLYSIIAPMGTKAFVSVGTVPGELINQSRYDTESMDDFNYKAILKPGEGIEAPVRLSILPHHTWFGRNLFTYYTTYNQLIDNIEKYGQDYETRSELKIEKDIKAYSEKNMNSESVTIKAGQKVYLAATDNKEWIGMVAEDSSGGWVNAKDVTQSNFSGFVMFD